MDRRKSLKVLAISSLSAGLLLDSCKTEDKDAKKKTSNARPGKKPEKTSGLMKEEVQYLEKVKSETFFTPHEMSTITILADIIIPKDDVSGSASDAGVPDFIEFIVKDKPEFQLPMRGGMQWLDQQCLGRYKNVFSNCTNAQQIEMVDAIAYPKKAKPAMQPGVKFFNLMRNLTATGFYTSEIGVKDVGYIGNQPNAWNGVPEEVLKQYGVSYTEKEMRECASYT